MPKDMRKIYKLERICFIRGFKKDQIESLLLNPNAYSIVYAENKKIVGSLILYLDGYGAKVLTIAVHPTYRRSGIGRKMMLQAEQMARFMRAQRIGLEVSINNAAAINLYRSLNYEFEGIIENYYSWGDDAYFMAKNLER